MEQVVGKEFSIHATVEIGNLSDKAISIPTVDIRIVSLKLVSITTFTGKQMNHPEIRGPDPYWKTDEEEVMLNAVPELATAEQKTALVNGQDGLLYEAVFQARAPADMSPSLETDKVIRSYRFEIETRMEVCGKAFKHEFTVLNVAFSSNLSRKGAPEYYPLGEGWEHKVDDPPPLYTEAEEDEEKV